MDLSLEKLKEAVSIREQIHALERRIASLFGGSQETPAKVGGRKRRGRRAVSAETRAKLAASAKARWAKRGVASAPAKAAKAGQRRSGLTAAGRRRLSESMKARWAARRRAMGKK